MIFACAHMKHTSKTHFFDRRTWDIRIAPVDGHVCCSREKALIPAGKKAQPRLLGFLHATIAAYHARLVPDEVQVPC